MTSAPAHVAVIGAGAWGTALAQVAAASGPVTLWARDPELAERIERTRRNDAYLPGCALAGSVRVTADRRALADADLVLVATPAQHLGEQLAAAFPHLERRPLLLLCSKGIEAGTRRLMSEVAAEAAPGLPVGVLSGPTFAHEVARALPTAVTLACADEPLARAAIARIARPAFRPYWSDDVIGAEVGGAVKNVLAIACGVVVGRRLGENAKAALISRGFAEMLRFGLARGARGGTLAGLSGLGDLVLTCSSPASRNMSLGIAIGEGRSAAELLSERRTVAEGAFTAPVLMAAAEALGVEMPIARAVVELLAGERPLDAVIDGLLSRPLRAEGA